MFDGEIVKKKFPFKTNFGLRQFLVQDRAQDKVQDKVGLRKFSPKIFFAKSLIMSCLMEKILSRISTVLFFYLSRTFRCLSSLSCLYRQQ